MIQTERCYFCLLFSLLVLLPVIAGAQPTYENAFPNLDFSQPTEFQAPNTNSDLVFVAQKGGLVYAFENDSAATEQSTFLDLRDSVLSVEEQGLFGLAFHPDYAQNGYFYVHHTADNPRRSVIARYKVDPDNPRKALRDSQKVLLEVDQPHSTHNGGELEFGPDGYLYASLGDGEVTSDGDPYDNGQDRSTLLGTVLRIDVDTTDPGLNYGIPDSNPFVGDSTCGDGTEACRGEIYAYGFRNPWRFSFDSETGRLWLGDVGHNRYEEIDVIKKGENYGWSIMEGKHCFDPRTGCETEGLTMPVYEYAHDNRRRSVTGGVVYRGSALPSLQGKYLYADFVINSVFKLTYDIFDRQWVTSRNRMFDDVRNVISFGTDRQNEVYMCSFDGNVYKIVNMDDTGIADGGDRPHKIELHENHPNPFNPATQISYTLPSGMHVELSVYNALGQRITRLVNRTQSAGRHTTQFQAKSLASGVYYYQLRTPTATRTGKMTLMK